jgi:hypothetical protein
MSKHFRGAIEYQSVAPNDTDRITGLRTNFGHLNKLWIVVSFVHMAMVMLLYGESLTGLGWFINLVSTIIMVLGIDLALMWLSSYIELQTTHKQPIGAWPWTAFGVSLLVELGFNIGALWSHAPASLGWLGKVLAVVFGTFVALIIYVSATIQSRLDRTREYIATVQRSEAKRRADEARQQEREARQQEREAQQQNRALESHNEALPPPNEATLMPASNGKSRIAADDLRAIVRVLYEQNITQLDNAGQLRELCGWSSYSTSSKARDNLLSAGILREVAGGGFVIDYAKAETELREV